MKLTTNDKSATKFGTKENPQKVVCKLELDWSGITEDQLQYFAQRQVITDWKNTNRVANILPRENETIKVADYLPGKARVTQMTPEQALAAMTPEQLQAFLLSKGIKLG